VSDGPERRRRGWRTEWLPGEVVRPSKPGNAYVRVRREDLGAFKRTRRGVLVATEEASAPASRLGQLVSRARDLVIGRPLESEAIGSERLSVVKALPILSSDALSSVAYGPEAALTVLAAAGASALIWNVPIAIAVALLMLIVTFSYQQVIRGYQGGGGSYAVARANLGLVFGLIAAAALLVDYVLTVSVSVSSGVDALLSTFDVLLPYRPVISVGLIALLLVGNLRGVREAGAMFAVPTYLFIVATLVLIGAGLVKAALGGAPHPGQYPPLPAREPLAPLLILAAFASGCSSMTGIEAVSNSVPVFYEPRVRNAVRTLALLGGLLIVLFLGVEALDVLYAVAPRPNSNPTVLSQIASAVFTGPLRWAYYGVQFSTLLVLVLAANTSFNGFPRLCAILAKDDFLPHRFAILGNRLVYSGAITFLAVAATLLMLAFSGSTDALINLFALGVFTAFSLAQAGMARHWWTHRRKRGARRGLVINAVGALVTALVDAVIIITKSPRGAWVVIVLVPLLVLGFMMIHRHYQRVREELDRMGASGARSRMGPVVVAVLRWDEAADDALGYASALRDHVIVLCADQPGHPSRLPAGAEVREVGGSGVDALLEGVDAVRAGAGDAVVTVVLPDVSQPLWLQILLRPDLTRLKFALLWRRNVVAASCPGFGEGRQGRSTDRPEHVAFVPLKGLDAASMAALGYARGLGAEVVAIHVVTDVEEVARHHLDEVPDQFERWAGQLEGDAPHLVVIESPYRSLVPPLLSYIIRWRQKHPEPVCTVVLPEVIDRHWLTTLFLHNHRAFAIKAALLQRKGIAVADVTLHTGG
jgi:amino acid transporter